MNEYMNSRVPGASESGASDDVAPVGVAEACQNPDVRIALCLAAMDRQEEVAAQADRVGATPEEKWQRMKGVADTVEAVMAMLDMEAAHYGPAVQAAPQEVTPQGERQGIVKYVAGFSRYVLRDIMGIGKPSSTL